MILKFNGINLTELFLNFGRKCKDIYPENMIWQYLAPHQKMYVTLNEDDDVCIMIHLHTCMRSTIINMKEVRKDQMQGNISGRSCEDIRFTTRNIGHLYSKKNSICPIKAGVWKAYWQYFTVDATCQRLHNQFLSRNGQKNGFLEIGGVW